MALKIKETFKNMEPTDSLKDRLEEKLNHITEHVPGVREAQCIFKIEGSRHIVDVTLYATHKEFFAEAGSTDMYASIDLVVHKLQTQLRRFKEKIKNHKSFEQSNAGKLRYAENLFDEKRLKEDAKHRNDEE
ncbi:MAG: ribosome-associated translation inhibitor RaiA [Deltaproteobacteria bacterium]|nr:ribosome-associated translation inhibitor RaiA [Deltaproteobacteria bacterium]